MKRNGGIIMPDLTLVNRNWDILEHLRLVEKDRHAGVPEMTVAEAETKLNEILAEMGTVIRDEAV